MDPSPDDVDHARLLRLSFEESSIRRLDRP